jgi:hypothetical protein
MMARLSSSPAASFIDYDAALPPRSDSVPPSRWAQSISRRRRLMIFCCALSAILLFDHSCQRVL